MADLELTVHCRTLPNKVGFAVMCVLLPIWALIIPTCLGLFTSWLLQNPNVQSLLVMMLLLGLAVIPVAGVLLTAAVDPLIRYASASDLLHELTYNE